MTLAYLDPGSGSLIASALVGGVAAAGVAAKQARARFSAGFGRKRKQETEFSAENGDTTDDSADTAAPADADADAVSSEAEADESTSVTADS